MLAIDLWICSNLLNQKYNLMLEIQNFLNAFTDHNINNNNNNNNNSSNKSRHFFPFYLVLFQHHTLTPSSDILEILFQIWESTFFIFWTYKL